MDDPTTVHCAIKSQIIKLKGELRGDNLPNPISCILEINCEVDHKPMQRADVEPYLDGD